MFIQKKTTSNKRNSTNSRNFNFTPTLPTHEMVMAAFGDQVDIRTRRTTELSGIDVFSASLASTLRSLSIGTFHQFHSFTAQANSLAGNAREPTCPSPGEENSPPESSSSTAHGNSMALDDDSCSRKSVRPRCLKRETRRPNSLKVDKTTVADLDSLPTDTPTTRLVKTHLRSQSSRGVSKATAPHGGLAARVDLPGAAHEQLGMRPFARLAISTHSKEVRNLHAPRNVKLGRAGSAPFARLAISTYSKEVRHPHAPRNVKWGRAGSMPFLGSPRGRMLASGTGQPDMIFPGDAFLR
jgi:hypothetical protein